MCHAWTFVSSSDPACQTCFTQTLSFPNPGDVFLTVVLLLPILPSSLILSMPQYHSCFIYFFLMFSVTFCENNVRSGCFWVIPNTFFTCGKKRGKCYNCRKKKIMKKITLWLRSISHPEEEVEWKQVPFVTLILLHLLCSRNILFIKSYLRKWCLKV